MTRVLTVTFVGDGSSDRALVPIVEWLLTEKLGDRPYRVAMAEGLPPWKDGLTGRIAFAQRRYPCDVLVIHRDAEAISWNERVEEINDAVRSLQLSVWLPVVPVRMTEAWLLFDSQSIRRAAGNPQGTIALDLPIRARWEAEPDPKQKLFDALRISSELHGRRLKKFKEHEACARLANLIVDFGYLRGLVSFDEFEKKLDEQLRLVGV